jgi:hypothetical protein
MSSYFELRHYYIKWAICSWLLLLILYGDQTRDLLRSSWIYKLRHQFGHKKNIYLLTKFPCEQTCNFVILRICSQMSGKSVMIRKFHSRYPLLTHYVLLLTKGQSTEWHGPTAQSDSNIISLTGCLHIIFMTRYNLSKIDTFSPGSHPLWRDEQVFCICHWINYSDTMVYLA